MEVTLDIVYRELLSLHRDVEALKGAAVPTEKISAKEREELAKIAKEMTAGKKHSFREVFGGE